MAVAVVGGRVVGFLQPLHSKDGILTVDLIATDNEQRRKGIASDMIAFIENESNGASKVRVGTQISNTPSLRLYEKLGFRVSSSHYVFHYHSLGAA